MRAPQPRTTGKRRGKGKDRGASGPRADAPVQLEPAAIVRQIKTLEARMFAKARKLEFEEAAALRDQIEKLQADRAGTLRPDDA